MNERKAERDRYPARSRRQVPVAGLTEGARVWISGRLLAETDGSLRLQDSSGRVPVAFEHGSPAREHTRDAARTAPGDLADLCGRLEKGIFVVEEIVRMAPGLPSSGRGSSNAALWKAGAAPFIRMNLLEDSVRRFFRERGFLEVRTPRLLPAGGQEPHLNPFHTTVETAGGEIPAFLITSPEYCHKRLLAAGHEKIFEAARVFRNGPEEGRDRHWFEFTMLEWYRAFASYEEIMEDVENLVFHAAMSVDARAAAAFRPPFRRISLKQAFSQFAAVDLEPYLAGNEKDFARREAEEGRFSLDPHDAPGDRFFKILVAVVEPALSNLGPVFLVDFPAAQAALSKISPDDPRVCERFELYINGVELANGFTELNDPVEQRRRFEEEAGIKAARGLAAVPIDESFLEALELGMPPAGGVALGMDRLAMVLFGEETLDAFLPFGRYL